MWLNSWKEGIAPQNEDFLLPRHNNAKKPTGAAYYRNESQTISKDITMLNESYSSSSIYNEVNHEAKVSVGEEVRDPKQLQNLKQNLNKTKSESTSNSGQSDRILASLKLEQGKSFKRKVTILPQYWVIFAFTYDCFEGVERYCVNSSSAFRCDTLSEIMNKL